ncbi:DUF4177 domain-containing protein [Sediminibacillus halophilus]|uniref:DUF4177 domain-containing protein n=1 Tax=Sediminibacillus halophilus TaxID=482461 RepID=A0A1G9W4V1_9BACI|nr:DUF4177 domain-containing protein [Sediminibacillus halophilus]SDM79558.1 protein of unknown function [Sediminibacillus halophilus]
MYEHKFIKIDRNYNQKPKEDYHRIVSEHEKEGWELVQIFAPSTKSYGLAAYFELILKRKLQESD